MIGEDILAYHALVLAFVFGVVLLAVRRYRQQRALARITERSAQVHGRG